MERKFVATGRISFSEIDLVHIKCERSHGVHVAGERLDVDGVTGGFNFQHCWASGWIDRQAIAEPLL